MLRPSSPAGRYRPLALTLAALGTLAACADGPPATAPNALGAPAFAVGDVYTVTSTSGGTGAGSLRWAVAQATGGETLRFDPALAGATITLDTTLVVRTSLTIEGPHDKGITISGGGKVRVIGVEGYSPTLTLRNLSITGGIAPSNEAAGGILAFGNLVLEHTTVWKNEAYLYGAIDAAALTLINSTVSGNVSRNGYGVIGAGTVLEVVNSTVADNVGGGIGLSGWTLLRNSIIARNAAGENCYTYSITYEGTNLSDNATCADSTVMLIGDPKLEPLADNGGPTMTHALAPTSPAVNAGKGCTVAVDQRYRTRDTQCDIGAFEFTDPTVVTLTVDPSASVDLSTGIARVAGTVNCSRNGDQFGVRVEIQQQKTDNAQTVVRGTGEVTIQCTRSARPWSALVIPAAGVFKNGAAAATASTVQVASWVTPATTSRSVTLVGPRK